MILFGCSVPKILYCCLCRLNGCPWKCDHVLKTNSSQRKGLYHTCTIPNIVLLWSEIHVQSYSFAGYFWGTVYISIPDFKMSIIISTKWKINSYLIWLKELTF